MIPEQRVLLAVINAAIVDMCIPPVLPAGAPKKRNNEPTDYRLEKNAHSAFRFFFGDGLEAYCNFLEMEPSWLRTKLQEFMFSDKIRVANGKEALRISDEQRRIYRFNHSIWTKKGSPCFTSSEGISNPLPVRQVVSRYDPSDHESDQLIVSHLRAGKRPSRRTNSGSKAFTFMAASLAGVKHGQD